MCIRDRDIEVAGEMCDVHFWLKYLVEITHNDLSWDTFQVPGQLAELLEETSNAYLNVRPVFGMAARAVVQAKGHEVVQDALKVLLGGHDGPSPSADEDTPQILETIETLSERESPVDAAAIAFCRVWLRTVREGQQAEAATPT